MKKLFFLLLLSLCLLLSACSPAQPTSTGGDGPLTVVTTTYPAYLFTTAVTGGIEGIEVIQINTDVGACLHDYTLTVSDMKAIEGADVIVINGAGLEDFMSDALSRSSAAVIDCSRDITLLPALGHEGHDHETEYDPHIWMRTDNAAVMVRTIADGLSQLLPDHASDFSSRADAAAALLSQEEAPPAALNGRALITFHDGFQYFAQACGLDLLKSIEEEEGAETSAAEIREIVELIRRHDIPAIFTEVNGSDATARAISRETGCAIYPLSMIMSGEGTGIQPYLDAMRANIDTVVEALG